MVHSGRRFDGLLRSTMTDDTTDEGDESELVNVPRKLLNRVLDRVDDLEERLSEYEAENEHDKATIRQDVNTAIEKADEATSSEPTESDESAESGSKETPMHQLVEAGEAGVIGHVTPSIRRAKILAEHFGQWAKKTPNGYVIRSNLKELLSMATGEQLEWSQVNRACRRLAEFSRGAIGFKKTSKHGNILIGQPDDHRLQSLLSSAG